LWVQAQDFLWGNWAAFTYSDLENVKEYRKTMMPIYSRVLLDRKKFKAPFASFVKKPFLMLSKDCGKKV
jgi:hypothetical protein